MNNTSIEDFLVWVYESNAHTQSKSFSSHNFRVCECATCGGIQKTIESFNSAGPLKAFHPDTPSWKLNSIDISKKYEGPFM